MARPPQRRTRSPRGQARSPRRREDKRCSPRRRTGKGKQARSPRRREDKRCSPRRRTGKGKEGSGARTTLDEQTILRDLYCYRFASLRCSATVRPGFTWLRPPPSRRQYGQRLSRMPLKTARDKCHPAVSIPTAGRRRRSSMRRYSMRCSTRRCPATSRLQHSKQRA